MDSLSELRHLKTRHPEETAVDLLERLAFRQYLRTGQVEAVTREMMRAANGTKYATDQPRVPEGAPLGEDGQASARMAAHLRKAQDKAGERRECKPSASWLNSVA
jgi:hypothetical protein